MEDNRSEDGLFLQLHHVVDPCYIRTSLGVSPYGEKVFLHLQGSIISPTGNTRGLQGNGSSDDNDH